MNRLTQKDEQGNWMLKGVIWNQLHVGQTITKEVNERIYSALCKLKDYEDTDCTPDEVNDLVEFDGSNTKKLLIEIANHRWVPVSEKLPKDNEFVLVQVNGKPLPNINLDNAFLLAEYYTGEGWCIEGFEEWETPDVVSHGCPFRSRTAHENSIRIYNQYSRQEPDSGARDHPGVLRAFRGGRN